MTWNPAAHRLELQPESNSQPAIRPTQLIFHSLAAPWTGQRTYEYWRDGTNLESHFYVEYGGGLYQYMGTETRADANFEANRRPDGTGAISCETAAKVDNSDPWTAEQVAALIALAVWACKTHGIPPRIAPAWDLPGIGYHRLFRPWSTSGTACPGDARVQQFHDQVMPGIAAAMEDDMTPAQAKQLLDVHKAVVEASIRSRVDGVLHTLADHTSATNAAVTVLDAKVDKILAALKPKA